MQDHIVASGTPQGVFDYFSALFWDGASRLNNRVGRLNFVFLTLFFLYLYLYWYGAYGVELQVK